jgi:VanZ family protein
MPLKRDMEVIMKIKYLSWMPAVLIMVAIFLFSSKPADSSNESSMVIVNQIIDIYQKITNVRYQADETEQIKQVLNHMVRKSAHFCEYAFLAASVAFHLLVWKRQGLPLFLLPVLTVFLYAATDEFHQTFISGRAGLFRDVLIDTAGGVTGSIIFTLIVIFMMKRRKSRKAAVI